VSLEALGDPSQGIILKRRNIWVLAPHRNAQVAHRLPVADVSRGRWPAGPGSAMRVEARVLCLASAGANSPIDSLDDRLILRER
jgi:hypothetical protein